MRIIFFLLLMIPLETIQAQKHEFGIHITGINSSNILTTESDKSENFKSFYSIAANLGFDYFFRIKESKTHLYFSLTNASRRTRVLFIPFPTPENSNPTARSARATTVNFWGLKYGIRKQEFLVKNLDLTFGLFTRFEGLTNVGLGRVTCNENNCKGGFIRYINYYSNGINLHTSLFLKLDFGLLKSKKLKHFISGHLIYNYGLQKIYSTKHYLKNVLTDEEFNFELVNRGSYFGVGLSYRIGSMNEKFKSIFKSK